MSTISATLGDAAQRIAISHNGKTYSISPLTGIIKSALERWMEDNERERILANAKAAREAGLISSREVMDMLEKFSRDCAKGRFAFGGPEMADLMKPMSDTTAVTPTQFRLMGLMIGATDAELFDLMLAKPDELMSKFTQVLAESVPSHADITSATSAAAGSDPKA